jgi:hypothetical protein
MRMNETPILGVVGIDNDARGAVVGPHLQTIAKIILL